jgi:UDP-N-acetylglucosamine 2-epimerase (non-hydrolysing)
LISFIVGTTAELIKMAPVYHDLTNRGVRPRLWYTAQHVAGVEETLAHLNLPMPDIWLTRGVRGRSLERSADVPHWLGDLAQGLGRNRRRLRSDLLEGDGRPLVVVHGDTFTTPIGALFGRSLGVTVAHVEAGMRSGSVRSPFPEELNRRLTSRLTDIHFAPTAREVYNLRARRGVVVETGANTVIDAVRLLSDRGVRPAGLPAKYGIATLHRFELLRDDEQLRKIVTLLEQEGTDETPIVFFAGAHEQDRLRAIGLVSRFDGRRLRLKHKLAYSEFLQVLAGTSFVVTDSGGLQQECAYLGIPCVVHRERTESHQGLGDNVVLSRMDIAVVRDVVRSHEDLRRGSQLNAFSPSKVIGDTLDLLGHL